MVTDSSTFDSAMPDWADWQQSPWGRLRYIQAEANLVPFLASTPMNILDVAGGNGVEALRLAKMGHHVTIVDYSEQMLEAAQRAVSDTGTGDRISLVHANVESMQASLSRTGYDGALCHNLIQYLDDPQSALRNIADCLRSDGFLSVITPNRDSEPIHLATRALDPAAALKSLDSTKSRTQMFNTDVSRYSADEVKNWLTQLELTVVGHYGIRSVSDYIYDNDLKQDPTFFAQLTRLELALASRMPFPLIARFLHIVGRVA